MPDLLYECESIRERLPELADGTLAGRELTRVEQHVTSCARCRQEVADLRTVIGAVRAIPRDEVPETLAPRLRRALGERAPAPGLRVLWPRLAIPLAVLAGVIAIGFALRTPRLNQQYVPGGGVASLSAEAKATRGVSQPAAARGGGTAQAPAAARRGGMFATEGERAGQPSGLPPQVAQAPVVRLDETRLADRSQAPPTHAGSPESADQMRQTEKLERPAASAAEIEGQVTGGGALGRAGGMLAAPRTAPATAGGARGGPGRVSGPRAELRSHRQGPRERPGPYAMRDRFFRSARGGGKRAAPGAAGPMVATKEAAAPPAFATASLIKGAGGNLIAVEVASKGATDTITVRIGGAAPQTFHWRGASGRRATVPLPLDKLGPGPTSVPLEIASSAGKHDYMLFLPTMKRLGEVAPTAPAARYERAPLRSVLADFSAMTGLVILAEGRVDAEIEGPIPQGTPEESLRRLGEAVGFDVQAQGDVVFTLTRRR